MIKNADKNPKNIAQINQPNNAQMYNLRLQERYVTKSRFW